MTSGSYPADKERRRQQRYAVISGLAANRYAPRSGNVIRWTDLPYYDALPAPHDPGVVPDDFWQPTPYEWFLKEKPNQPDSDGSDSDSKNEYGNVLVLWLYNGHFFKNPATVIQYLKHYLQQSIRKESADEDGDLPADFVFVGPYGTSVISELYFQAGYNYERLKEVSEYLSAPTMSKQVTELDKRAKDLAQEIRESQKAIEESNAELWDYKNRFADLEGEIEVYDKQRLDILELNLEIDELEITLAGLSDSMEGVSSLKDKIQQLEKSRESLSDKLQTARTAKAYQTSLINEIQGKRVLVDRIAQANQRIRELLAEMESNESKRKKLEDTPTFLGLEDHGTYDVYYRAEQIQKVSKVDKRTASDAGIELTKASQLAWEKEKRVLQALIDKADVERKHLEADIKSIVLKLMEGESEAAKKIAAIAQGLRVTEFPIPDVTFKKLNSSVREDLNEIEARRSARDTEIKRYEAEIEKLEPVITDLEIQLNKQAGLENPEEAEFLLEDYQDWIDILERDLEELRSEREDLVSDYDQGLHLAKKESYDSLSVKLSDFENTHSSRIISLNAVIATAEDQLARIEDQRSRYQFLLQNQITPTYLVSTSSTTDLSAFHPVETFGEDTFYDALGMRLIQAIHYDETVLECIVRELNKRDIRSANGDRVVLIGESDTLFSRRLASDFKEIYLRDVGKRDCEEESDPEEESRIPRKGQIPRKGRMLRMIRKLKMTSILRTSWLPTTVISGALTGWFPEVKGEMTVRRAGPLISGP